MWPFFSPKKPDAPVVAPFPLVAAGAPKPAAAKPLASTTPSPATAAPGSGGSGISGKPAAPFVPNTAQHARELQAAALAAELVKPASSASPVKPSAAAAAAATTPGSTGSPQEDRSEKKKASRTEDFEVDSRNNLWREGPSGSSLSEEYERRLKVLSMCLEEKAEENVELYAKLSEFEENKKRIDAMERQMSVLKMELERKEEEMKQLSEVAVNVPHQTDLIEEFLRRIQVLGACLEDMAKENEKLLNKIAEIEGKSPPASPFSAPVASALSAAASKPSAAAAVSPLGAQMSAAAKQLTRSFDKVAIDKVVNSHHDSSVLRQHLLELSKRETIDESVRTLLLTAADMWNKDLDDCRRAELQAEEIAQLRISIATAERENKALTAKAQKESDNAQSYMESCEKYEKKLRRAEQKAKDNLQKEGRRRQDAEYRVGKLRSKVAELQFLLKAQQGDSDSSSSSSSESDDK